MNFSRGYLLILFACGPAHADVNEDMSKLRTEINEIRSVYIAQLHNEITSLRNELAQLQELTLPLKLQRQADQIRQHKDVCAYLRKEIKAGRLSKEDSAKIQCE